MLRMSSKDFKLVYVEWVDAWGPHSWSEIEDVGEDVSLIIHSIGWMIKETDDYMAVAGHITEMGQASGIILIPKVSIQAKRVIDAVAAQ